MCGDAMIEHNDFKVWFAKHNIDIMSKRMHDISEELYLIGFKNGYDKAQQDQNQSYIDLIRKKGIDI